MKDRAESTPVLDVVAVALERSRLPASAVLMIGDTPYDIDTAGKVGAGIMALLRARFGDDRLASAFATDDAPVDLLARYKISPLGR